MPPAPSAVDTPVSDLPETRIAPIYNQIVVLRDRPPTQIELIVLPDVVQDRLAREITRGVVLRVGPGKYRRRRDAYGVLRDTRERVQMELQRGDIIWFHPQAGVSEAQMADIEENGQRITVMWDDEAQAVDGDRWCELRQAAAE